MSCMDDGGRKRRGKADRSGHGAEAVMIVGIVGVTSPMQIQCGRHARMFRVGGLPAHTRVYLE